MSEPTSESDRPSSSGWFKAPRTEDAFELIRANRNAFILLYVIAYRAQWKSGFNRHNLELGQALIGDHKTYGMTEREYRTAKQDLAKWGFATFKATSKGTIATLVDSRVFSIFSNSSDGQNDTQATDRRRTGDGQATTTKTAKKAETAKEGGERQQPANTSGPPARSPSELILREKELERIETAISKLRDQCSSDAFGIHPDSMQQVNLKRLKARRDELKALLGFEA